MRFLKFLFVDEKTIESGATAKVTWTSDDDYIIKYIFAIDKDEASLAKVRATIAIQKDYITEDYVPLKLLGSDKFTGFEIDRTITKGETLSIDIKNEDTTSHTIMFVLGLYTPS